MSNSIGIYIHIPYCRSKCPYCDFFSKRGNDTEYKNYLKILTDKIINWGKKIDKPVDTIYFGGGTPSLIGDKNIADIIKCIKNCFDVDEKSEITIEVNPESAKHLDFENLYSVGVNRISIGLQSADKNELKQLGRIHSLKDAVDTIYLSKNAGIDNISLDVMLGISNQTDESLIKTLEFIANSGVKHISSYILKLEENTFYYKNRDRYNFPDDETTSNFYLKTVNYLNKNGFVQYEISNFAVKGYESKHNLKYWNLDEYLGIGPAAHSFIDGKRFYYDRSIEDFKNDIIIDEGLGGDKEEFIMLKLRLKKGLNIGEYEKAFGKLSKDFFKKIELYTNSGFTEYKNNTLSFTPKGFLVSNNIISDLI
ncbi:MAG: radical SAM family heme chaperone HemW [Ruminococcus sp.]|nr:radical SAM family heme chaperone HemW [Ruminococcus sp.]